LVIRELKKRYEGALQRVSDLECENARLVEEFMNSTNEKEAKLKEN